MQDYKQLAKEFINTFNIKNLQNRFSDSDNVTIDEVDNFISVFKKSQNDIEKALVEIQRSGEFSELEKMGPLPITSDWFQGVLKDYENSIINSSQDASQPDNEGLVKCLIGAVNDSAKTIRENPEDFGFLKDKRSINYISATINSLKNSSSFLDGAVVDDVNDEDLFRIFRNLTIPDIVDNFSLHHNKAKSAYQLLTAEIISGASKSQTNEELKGIQERFQHLLENLSGYKDFIAESFVLGRQYAVNTYEGIKDRGNIKDAISMFDTLKYAKNFGAKEYLFILNELEKSNQNEAQQLKNAGQRKVHAWQYDTVDFIFASITGIQSYNVPIHTDESFDIAFANFMEEMDDKKAKSNISLQLLSDFQTDNTMIISSPFMLQKSSGDSHGVSFYKKDLNTGVFQKVSYSSDIYAPIPDAMPFGRLLSEKHVIEQVTPTILNNLLYAFSPSLREIAKNNSIELLGSIEKIHRKVGEDKLIAKEFAILKEHGVKIAIPQNTNAPSYDRVSNNGLMDYIDHNAHLSPIIANPELAKELNKVGLVSGTMDLVDSLVDKWWIEGTQTVSKLYSGHLLKKLISRTIVEANITKVQEDKSNFTDIKSGQGDMSVSTRDFLTLVGKLSFDSFATASLLQKADSKEAPADVFKKFAEQIYETLDGFSAHKLLDKNGTSPLIRLLNESKRIKGLSSVHAPVFVQDDKGIRMIEAGIKEQFVTRNKQQLEYTKQKEILSRIGCIDDNLSMLLNNAIPPSFFEGDNVKPLMQGRDDNGNNILHLLLQNPKLFVTKREWEASLNNEGELPSVTRGSAFSKLILKCFLNDTFNNVNERDYSSLTHFVKQIPQEELKRLANEKNNAGRTPLEELCYFAEFIKERAYASFTLAKGYTDFIEDVIKSSANIKHDGGYKVLQRQEEFFTHTDSGNEGSFTQTGISNELKTQIATEKEEGLIDIINFLSTPNKITKGKTFKKALEECVNNIQLEDVIRKSGTKLKTSVNKLPL